jgi:guanylate kinase
MRANGEFLESAEVFGNYYGTPASQVGDMLAKGTDVLFDIDWQGTRQLTQKARQDVVSVFILPPSMEELELRLRKRAEDTEEVLQHRMSKANVEISHWNEYDYVVVNKDLEESLQKVYSILRAERLRRERQEGLQHFVNQLLKGKAA